ncbi:MAG TPA: serine hydrolase domain-containing protein [Polyangiaceae bacterium]|nr:serine hydrolase domain-containing protein [Polyangiaceae bacterium]
MNTIRSIRRFSRNSFSAISSLGLLAAALLAACSDAGDTTSVDPTSSETPAPEPALDAAAIADLEARADRLIAAGVPGVSVAVIAGDQSVLIARGVADRATGEPMTPDHRFRVASMAKSVVASTILQLSAEGELALSDTVEDWLPGMLPENSDATLENLLRLESGIFSYDEDERHMAPYYAGDFEHRWTPESLVGLAAEHPALFRPGERFYYSNTNYVLLGLIIQKITGRELADVVHERVLDPVGMSASDMPLGSELEAPFARGYMLGVGDEPLDVTGISASSVFGNGNLVGTALDMATLYGALVRGDVVSEAQLPDMFRHDPNVPDTHYGMGVWRFDGDFQPCGSFVGHDGGAPGYDVTAFSSLDGSRQYAVLANNLAPGDKVGDEAAQQAWKELVFAAACN